jgi:hypothetical protein
MQPYDQRERERSSRCARRTREQAIEKSLWSALSPSRTTWIQFTGASVSGQIGHLDTWKTDLIERVNNAWATLEETLAGADEAAWTAPGGDGWSAQDHLAHIESWERYLLAVLERRSPAAAIGTDPATLGSTDGDALNDLLIAPARAHSLAQVLADLRETHERLLAAVAAVPDDNLDRLAVDYQPEELAGDQDSLARWIDHVCDEHLRDHVGWIGQLTANR